VVDVVVFDECVLSELQTQVSLLLGGNDGTCNGGEGRGVTLG